VRRRSWRGERFGDNGVRRGAADRRVREDMRRVRGDARKSMRAGALCEAKRYVIFAIRLPLYTLLCRLLCRCFHVREDSVARYYAYRLLLRYFAYGGAFAVARL